MTEKQLSRNRMGSIDTWSFGEGNTSYAERFELAVGCSPARYAEIVDPKALLDLRNDAAGYAAAQRRAREVGECKAELCVLLVLEAIACQVGCTPEALGEQLAGTCTIDVNMNDVARRLDGPLTLGSKTVRPNAGQCLKDLLHRHARVNVGLLSSPDDRGVHTTRRAHATVQVGGRAVCVPQGPTIKQVRAAFEEHWVKSGLVNLGVPIVKWEYTWVPGMDGEWVDTERDQSGRLLPKMEMLPPLAEKLREDDVLRSMPDFDMMPMAHVALHLQRAKLPARGAREAESAVRARARAGLLYRRSARTQPKPAACTHSCRSLRCPNCLRSASACECAPRPEAVPACRECVRGGRAAPAEVRADLAVRGVTQQFDYPAWALARLIALEADDDVREDLVSIREPASLPDETPEARERRFARWQNRLQLWVWSDDSPIAKKTMMVHLWGWLYHPLKMQWSRKVGQMCMQPQLSAIMNVSATLEDTRFYNRAVMLDLHTLAEGINLGDGTHINIDLRVDKYDGQQGAKDLGCSSGAAHWSCACCGQSIQGHPDLVACLECEPRGLGSLSDRAALCAQVPGFEAKIDLRASCKADLAALVQKLGGGDVTHLNKPAVLAKAQSLTMGQVGDPAIKGGLHLDDLTMLMGRGGHVGMEGVYDFSLHATTGQTKEMLLRRLPKLLSTSDRAALLAMQNKMFGDKCAYTGADVRLRLFALQWMVTKLGLVSAQAGRGAHMLHACNYWARLHPVCFRVRYADWHNNYHGCVLRATGLFYLYAHELRQAAPPGKSKGRVDVLWLTYFHQAMHAIEHLQYLPPCLNECERCEAQFKDVREQAKSSSNHLQSMQAAVVIGNQMEKYVKAEYACEGGEAASDRRFHKHYEQSYCALDDEHLKFGWEHWGLDANWGWVIRLLAPFLVHRSCWRVEGTGDDAVFVLLCGDLSLWLATPRLDYALCTLGDVRARAAAAYEQLQQQLTDPLERRVLLGEGLPPRAPLAVPRQVPATAARKGVGEGSSEDSESDESESDSESSEESDDEGSDEWEGGEGAGHAGEEVRPPDKYELTCLSYSGDVLTARNPRGFGVTVERWERPRHGGMRTITYSGEHSLDAEGVRKREGHGTERCDFYKKGSARMQGQWRANCFYGLGERQNEEGVVHRGEWVLQSASGESVLQGWGEKLRYADAPAPYEYGKYALDPDGCSMLDGDCVNLPAEFTEQLEVAVEEAAQAAAKGEKAVRMAAARAHGGPLAAQQVADAGGSEPAAAPPPLHAAPEGAAARIMRKALTGAQQHLVDTFEAARRSDDDDDATTRALHAVLDAIALLHIPDRKAMDGHRAAGGHSWNGTEQGAGTLCAADAKAVWLRWAAAEKVWQDHHYNLERYIRARESDPALLEWLGGRASLPAFDVPAGLRKAKLTPPKPMLPQRGQNPAQRTSGAAQVRAATAASTSTSALLQPTAQGNLNSQIAEVQKKLDALKKRKEEERRAQRLKDDAARQAASRRGGVSKQPQPLRAARTQQRQ